MRTYVLAILAISGCARVAPLPPPDIHAQHVLEPCITRCGLMAAGRCDALQEAEDRARRVFGQYSDAWGSEDVCEAVKGFTIVMHDRDLIDETLCQDKTGTAWYYPGHQGCILGLTRFESKTITLPNDQWETNAFAHEIAHTVDYLKGSAGGHCFWKERGVKRALRAFTGETDMTPAEKWCAAGAPE